MIERGLRVPHLLAIGRIAAAMSVSLSELFQFEAQAPDVRGQEPPACRREVGAKVADIPEKL
jgi:hypothetical protein